MPILKLDHDDESSEIEFELRYLKSLTIRERFLLMSYHQFTLCGALFTRRNCI